MKPLGLATVGIGGFGASYLASARRMDEAGLCRLRAVVVRSPQKHGTQLEELRGRGIRVYGNLQQLLDDERGRVHLVCIPTGIDSHAPLSIAALRAGYDVLCVKPVAGSVREATAMREARDRSGRTLAVGFQDIFTPSLQRIKAIALNGDLGRLRSARAYLSWPRTRMYYERNSWAGRLTVNGVPVLDCPIQNAAGHYLNQMLYVAGPSRDDALEPQSVYAENYRAKEIESADTQFVRVLGSDGVRLSLLASHAVREFSGPVIHYDFEGGLVTWEKETDGATGVTHAFRTAVAGAGSETGSTTAGISKDLGSIPIEEFSNAGVDPHDAVFENTLSALAAGRRPLCTIDNTWQHTTVVEAAFASSAIVDLPEAEVETLETVSGKADGAVGIPTVNRVISDYENHVSTMFETGASPAEVGLPWARFGTVVSTIS